MKALRSLVNLTRGLVILTIGVLGAALVVSIAQLN